MTKPTLIADNDLMDAVREMFPRCIHCGRPCLDPKTSKVVERKPGFRRLAHLDCDRQHTAA